MHIQLQFYNLCSIENVDTEVLNVIPAGALVVRAYSCRLDHVPVALSFLGVVLEVCAVIQVSPSESHGLIAAGLCQKPQNKPVLHAHGWLPQLKDLLRT